MRINPYLQEMQRTFGNKAPESAVPSGEGFATELKAKVEQVNQLQNQSEDAMRKGAVEGANNIHETMIKLEEADISLRMLTKVRGKAIEAYQEMMRMQF